MQPNTATVSSHHLPPGSIAEIAAPVIQDTLRCVRGARVVVADYSAIQRDFPGLSVQHICKQMPSLCGLSSSEIQSRVESIIDQWIVAQAAFVSVQQCVQNDVNTTIDATGEPIFGYRPPLYGRACIIPLRAVATDDRSVHQILSAAETGLLDVKGVGVGPGHAPLNAGHSNGLMSVGRAIASWLNGCILNAIFRSAHSPYTVLPHYAIVDLGFDMIGARGELIPTGLLIRQAHNRRLGGYLAPLHGFPEHSTCIEIELLLRQYGVTSCSPASEIHYINSAESLSILCGGNQIEVLDGQVASLFRKIVAAKPGRHIMDGINIQLSLGDNESACAVVDLDQFEVRMAFTRPLAAISGNSPFGISGVMNIDHPLFVQPGNRAISYDSWGGAASVAEAVFCPAHRDSWSRMNAKCFELASRFRSRSLSRQQLQMAIDHYLTLVLQDTCTR